MLRDAGLQQEDLMPIRKGLTLATQEIISKDFYALDTYPKGTVI